MERLRRTMMFMPAANPAMLRDAGLYGADSLMFDLEDAVSIKEKDTARALVHFALKTFDYGNAETIVRINALEDGGKLDIDSVVRAGVDVVRLPKTETAQDVIDADAVITEVEKACGREVGSTGIFAAIESAEGVLNALSIAQASPRVKGIALGAEDYVTNLKTRRAFGDNMQLYFAREMILHAARATGIAAVDTVYSAVDDEEGFKAEVEHIKTLGFDGKSVINPRQIPLVNEVYAPTEKEIQNAKEIVWATKEAEEKGLGVISVRGKMVDKPVIARAERTIQLAKASGLISEEDL